MKKILYSLTLILTINVFTNAVFAQNPKTNANKVDNSYPKGFQLPETPPINQIPQNTDSSNIVNSEPSYQNQNNNQTFLMPKKDSISDNSILFGLGLIVGIPQNAFKEANNIPGIGLGITCMYNFMGTDKIDKHPVNIYLGGTFEYLYFGGESNHFSFDDPYPYNAIYNTVTTSVNVNVYSLMISSRIEFLNGPIIPFLEVAVGGRLFDGNEKVTYDRTLHNGGSLPSGVSFSPTTTTDNTHLESDFVGAYGYGGGLRVGRGAIKAELKLMNMRGTKGKYIERESIKIDNNNNISYNTKTSTTDMLVPQISITATF